MRTVGIIQARMNSTRFPGKVMEDLGGQPILKTIIERAKKAGSLDELIVAVPYEERGKFECLIDWGVQYSSPAVPENDLVGRFYATAKTYEADLVVRLCADNPFVEPSEIDRAVEAYRCTPMIFCSNMHQHTGSVSGYPDGIGCEVFSRGRLGWLYWADITRFNPSRREHIHQVFHEHGLVDSPICPDEFARPDVKLDVNTPKDLEKLCALLEWTDKSPVDVHITDLITVWDGLCVKSG